MYTCRECEQPINQATEVCPYCGADLVELSADPAGGKTHRKSTSKIPIFLALIVSSIVAISWFAFPWRMAGSKSVAEAHGNWRHRGPPKSARRLSGYRGHVPVIAGASGWCGPCRVAECSVRSLHAAVHARQTGSRRSREDLRSHSARWKLRLSQSLHRRDRNHSRDS